MRTIKFSKGDKYKGNLILVNGLWPLQNDEKPPCVPILDQFPSVLLHIKASACLRQILKTIDAADSIVPVSGYRPLAEQEEIYREWDRIHREVCRKARLQRTPERAGH